MKLKSGYIRNLIFGAEDSFVSTVGVMFGVATANVELNTIILTGLIVISVEALSMGVGAYLSETSEQELNKEKLETNPKVSGVLMFLSYFFAGFIPLFPYLIIQNDLARYSSAIITAVALFILGFMPQKNLKSGIRMMLVAGTAIFIGYLIGSTFTKIY